jgi:hypothetical protein
MSIPFSDTVNRNGVIQLIEKNLGFSPGDISGNADLLADFTADVNLTIDEILGFMFPLGGTWQLDDSNHTDYPIVYANIVLGQRDYTFTTDEQGNYILDIYKVTVADPRGVYRELEAVDQQTLNGANYNTDTLIDGQNSSGIPTRYDKTANGIFLDLIPNYNYTRGLQVFINREASYFTVADTSKRLGFAHLFHEYLALRPSYIYATRKSMPIAGGRLKNGAYTGLASMVANMKEEIKNYYGSREKDAPAKMRPNVENTR